MEILFLYVFMPIRITRNSILEYIPFVIKAAKRHFIQLVAANLVTLTPNCAHTCNICLRFNKQSL